MLPLLRVKSVDSTNTEAWRLIEAGQALPFLLQAEEQLAGRGRIGSAWSSPPGNFYGTFALAQGGNAATSAQLSFVAALGLADTLETYGLDPALKWPNDILISGAKISGILLEKQGEAMLIGMGVNLLSHPALEAYATTSLLEQGIEVRAVDFGKSLQQRVAARVKAWQTDGFESIRSDWLTKAYRLGENIQVRFADGSKKSGIFKGLDTTGALQLGTNGGLETIHAGSVYF